MRDTNILQYLERTVAKVPDKTAFTDGEHSITFRELAAQAAAIGSWLCHQGVYKKPVVIYMKKQPKTIAAFFGTIYGGCFYIPLDEEMPRHRIDLILQNLEEGILICDETTAKSAETLEYRGQICNYDEIALGRIDREALLQVRRKQLDIDPIYIVFTSGSTGIPKGVMACHRSVIDYIEALCDILRCDASTVFGNQTPLYFDACLKELIPTIKYGATTYLIPRQLFLFPIKLVEYLNTYKINTLCWVVSALTMISSFRTFEKVIPEHIHTIAFASEVFPMRQFNLWKKALPQARFINLYGPTETTGICCYYEVEREFGEDETLPIGYPFPNTEIILLDEQNQIPEQGQQGEICIRGTRLTLGYYCNPEKTAEAFVQNPLNTSYPELIYRTGDIGALNERGELIFLSRKDYQIKHMGHRIELGEIETIVNMHPEVKISCCIFDNEKKKIVLFYVGDVESGVLTAYIKEKLPRYMVPNVIRQLEIMPFTPNGKIDRNLLKSIYHNKNK